MKLSEHLIRDLVLFAVMTFLTLVFWSNNLLLTVMLLTLSAIGMLYYTKTERLFFILVGGFGVLLEMLGGYIGIWRYASPNLFTVPFWIFFCWGITFMFLHSIYGLIEENLP